MDISRHVPKRARFSLRKARRRAWGEDELARLTFTGMLILDAEAD